MIRPLSLFRKASLVLIFAGFLLPAHATWQLQTSNTMQKLNGVANNGSTFAVVGDSTTRLTSINGITWVGPQIVLTRSAINDIVFDQGLFVAVGQGFGYSSNGTTWLSGPGFITAAPYFGVTSNGSRFVAVGQGGVRARSDNGMNWTVMGAAAETPDLYDVAANASTFVEVGAGGIARTSPDGITWTTRITPTANDLNGVTWTGSQFIAVGEGGVILTSPNGISWTSRISGTGQVLEDVYYNGSKHIAVGRNSTILLSNTGVTWTSVTNLLAKQWLGINSMGKVNILVGSGGSIARCVSPTITSQPSITAVCSGGNVTLSVTATGSSLSYQWQKDGVNIPGANQNQLQLTNVAAGDAAAYRCMVTNACGMETSAVANVTLLNPISITSRPANQTRCASDSVSFVVVASGSGPITYQWRKNGAAIPGATSSTLTLNNLASGDAGNYDCLVTGPCNTVNSGSATLTIRERVGIAANPSGLTRCAGEDAVFSVVATGTGPITYQWRKNAVNIPGETGSSLTLTSVTSADAATYSVIVSGPCRNVLTGSVPLVVQEPAAITAQPTNATACAGDNASFSVSASGTTPINYQWRKNGVNIPGATSATLNLTSVAAADQANYSCVITNSCASVTTNTASLTVNQAPSFSQQPQSQTLCSGENTSFTVAATGTPAPTFQWRKDNVDIPGATSATLSLTGIGSSDAGSYTCRITNTCTTIISNAASLTVNEGPAISQQPQSLALCDGDNASFSVATSGTPAPSFQWLKNGVDIPGATGDTLNLNGISNADAGNYSCRISNTCSSVTSNVASLTVNEAPSISQQPQSQALCVGDNATFSISISANPAPSFQWTKNGVDIPGATSATLNLNGISSADAGSYVCRITNSCSTTSSNAAALTVNEAPSFSQQPQSQTLCSGESTSFSVTATGTPAPSYQWRKDGVDIPGATSATLNLNGISSGDAGNYACRITNSCATATSNVATLIVNQPVAIVDEPESVAICPGGTATFTINASGLPQPTLQWQKDGANLPGETGTTLTINDLQVADEGTYTCIVSNVCGQTVSQNAILTVDGPLTVQVMPHVKPQGLFTLSLEAFADCVVPMSELEWLNLATGVPFGTNQNPVNLPSLTQTTAFRVAVTDDISREVATADATILVSENPDYFDFNNDGCNTVLDLIMMSEQWRLAIPDDPDGNGLINVLDYLYINVDQPSCL